MAEITIRNMHVDDWPPVQSIYWDGIQTGIATFETTIPSWEKWNAGHLPFGRLVAVCEEIIVGWVALSPVSTRAVYRGVAEVSIYVDNSFRQRRVGSTLLQQLIEVSEAHGIWTLQSSIFRENIASHRLHERLGFRTIGYREKVAQRDGHWKDNVLLERRSKVVGV